MAGSRIQIVSEAERPHRRPHHCRCGRTGRRPPYDVVALERNIVPLTCNGFQFSPDVSLPDDIARLRSFNVVTVPHEYFDAAMEKLRQRFLHLPETPRITPAPAATGFIP